MTFLLRYRLAILLIACVQSTLAQQISADSLLKKFDRHRQHTLQEKIYLHTDRTNYLTGETIWFKIYLTDASFHKPLGMSDVAYVEVIDEANQSIVQTKVALNDGMGNGSIYLPASISSGNFHIRAYTRWMKNSSADFFFHKQISIINTFKKLEKQSKALTAGIVANFFPEGGNLISGVTSKIAFQITDALGKGVAFSGAIINEQNDTITTFNPTQFGIGNFSLTPSSLHTYRAIVRNEAGKTTIHKLPLVFEKGYSLRVADTLSQQLAIHVKSRLDGNTIPMIYVFVHARQIIAHAEVKFLLQGSTTIHLDTKNLPEGISHITVFDATMKPVCERLYFKRPEKILTIAIQPDQPVYGNRRRVRINLQTALAKLDRSANVSVSVYKNDSLQMQTATMLDNFWLTSDLKGSIESAEYYLKPETSNEVIDNLMLTHGWRRFQWSEVLDNTLPSIPFIPENSGHIVNGIVRDQAGQPASGIITYLSSPGKITRLYGSRSNEQGEIYFEMQKFHGSATVVVQTNPKRDSTYRIEITSPFSNQFSSHAIPPLQLTSNLKKTLVERSVGMQVQDIYYTEQFHKPKVDSTSFYGVADEKYLLDDFTRFPVMEEVMREYVPGVLVRKRKDGFHFLVLDLVHKSVFEDTPLIMLDGIPIFDEDEIMVLDPLVIKKLEVVTKRYYLGPLSFPGIVSYTTYQGDMQGFPLQPKSVTLNYEGLQLQREFYSPQYEKKNDRESRMPDQRALLYWNPDVVTNAEGKHQIEFYTSDVAGDFKVVVEGITKDGLVGSATETFTVSTPMN